MIQFKSKRPTGEKLKRLEAARAAAEALLKKFEAAAKALRNYEAIHEKVSAKIAQLDEQDDGTDEKVSTDLRASRDQLGRLERSIEDATLKLGDYYAPVVEAASECRQAFVAACGDALIKQLRTLIAQALEPFSLRGFDQVFGDNLPTDATNALSRYLHNSAPALTAPAAARTLKQQVAKIDGLLAGETLFTFDPKAETKAPQRASVAAAAQSGAED